MKMKTRNTRTAERLRRHAAFSILSVTGLVLAAGCTTTTATQTGMGHAEHAAAEPSVAAGGYFEHAHDGRIYVVGSAESLASLKATGHMPYTLTKIGAGPAGETVVVEVDKKAPGMQVRLWDTFAERNLFYDVVARDGRLYVVGSAETKATVEGGGHMPYTLTKIGAGPGGETVIVEVDKKNPAMQNRLWNRFAQEHLFYDVVEHDGRLYVVGSAETKATVAGGGHMPYTLTKIGAGPHGETVVIEVDKKNPALQNRLWNTFRAEYLYYAEIPAHGRIYIVGSPKAQADFLKTHHLPYTRTLIGAGPNGETLVFEVDKKNDALVTRLQREFTARHGSK